MRAGYAALFIFLLAIPAAFAHFRVADTFIGDGFLHGFNWETMDDPTHGRVNFVDQSVALGSNLSFCTF